MSLLLQFGDKVIPADQRSGLQLKASSPGGFESVTYNVNRKLDKSLFESFTNVLVFDETTGEQVGGGRLLDQGRNDDGTWQILCIGEGFASMHDRKAPYFAIDGNLENWVLSSRSTTRLGADVGVYPNAPNDIDSLMLSPREGTTIVNGANLIMTNKLATLTDQNIGGFGVRHKSGFASANFKIRGRVYTAGMGTFDQVFERDWDTPMSTRIVTRVGTNWTNPRPIAALMWIRTTSDATATESIWSVANDPIIRAQLYGQDRVLRTDGYSNEYVLAHEIFVDWVARFCPRLDIGSARIDPSVEQIDQLAYLEGIDGIDLMVDLRNFDQAFAWHVWEKGPNGWVTEFVQLPTTPRYDATVYDGFVAPTPSSEIFNRVTVTGKSAGGRDVNYTATSTVDALSTAGITREDTMPAGSEVWSTTNAAKAATAFLEEHAVAPNAGTLRVSRPIRDNETGRWVKPWNIRPGGLVRVLGVQPTQDTLNATSPDGVTVFRIVSVTYDEDNQTATLELDTFTLDEQRAIADLYKRSRKR
jgi:hypothetical protein